MCFTKSIKHCTSVHSKGTPCLTCSVTNNVDDLFSPILPGLPDDVAKYCLALVPRTSFPTMGVVCKRWRSFIRSKEFLIVRKLASLLQEWLYILTSDTEGNGSNSHWEVFDCCGRKSSREVPRMLGPVKVGFGVVVLDGKLVVMGGYATHDGDKSPSADVYQYDPCLNSWSQIASMNIARYDFACAEVNGMLYAVGGYGLDGESLSSVEIFDPNTNEWTRIESLRRPRWGCFGFGLEKKLYIMGGRSSFTIGNSKFVDVYNTKTHTWSEMKKNGCVMVTTHVTLGSKLFCMEWKNPRKISVFDSNDNTWNTVHVPILGSSTVRFQLGKLDGKLLLFSEQNSGFYTLVYDPNAIVGEEWEIFPVIKSSGLCLCCVTIKV